MDVIPNGVTNSIYRRNYPRVWFEDPSREESIQQQEVIKLMVLMFKIENMGDTTLPVCPMFEVIHVGFKPSTSPRN